MEEEKEFLLYGQSRKDTKGQFLFSVDSGHNSASQFSVLVRQVIIIMSVIVHRKTGLLQPCSLAMGSLQQSVTAS